MRSLAAAVLACALTDLLKGHRLQRVAANPDAYRKLVKLAAHRTEGR